MLVFSKEVSDALPRTCPKKKLCPDLTIALSVVSGIDEVFHSFYPASAHHADNSENDAVAVSSAREQGICHTHDQISVPNTLFCAHS